jgi:hypothetical protein
MTLQGNCKISPRLTFPGKARLTKTGGLTVSSSSQKHSPYHAVCFPLPASLVRTSAAAFVERNETSFPSPASLEHTTVFLIVAYHERQNRKWCR